MERVLKTGDIFLNKQGMMLVVGKIHDPDSANFQIFIRAPLRILAEIIEEDGYKSVPESVLSEFNLSKPQ